MFLCCKLQAFYLDVAYFHMYVTSLCYRCFIHFRRMLHSSVSYCSESQGERGVMVARYGVLGNGAGEPVASGCGAQYPEG
jgi:hypothetical protein